MKMPKLRMPDVSPPKAGAAAKAVAGAAKEVAERSYKVGQVASEVQKASERMSGESSDRK